MPASFGKVLKRLRLRAEIGLRRFAEMLGMEPSNYSAMEHGRRKPPADPEKLREIAEALGLLEGSAEWSEFFDAARRPDALPADVRGVARRKLVPVLLRTIENRQLTDQDIAGLIAEIERRHGGGQDAIQ